MTNYDIASEILSMIKQKQTLHDIKKLLDENSWHAHNCEQALCGDNFLSVKCTCGADAVNKHN